MMVFGFLVLGRGRWLFTLGHWNDRTEIEQHGRLMTMADAGCFRLGEHHTEGLLGSKLHGRNVCTVVLW